MATMLHNESSSLRSPLLKAMPAPMGRGLYVEPPMTLADRWLPRLQIAAGVIAVAAILVGLFLGLTQ